MDKKLLERYLKYTNTEEAHAVLFVKKYLKESKGYWVDICDSYHYPLSEDPLAFKTVTCGLYKRTIKPKYPPKSEFLINDKFDEHRYITHVRAITWDTAHRDIEKQKEKNIKCIKYILNGVCYDINRNKGYFVDNAPSEIKELEKDLFDYTSPLWDLAINYRNFPKFVYQFKSIKRLK